MQIKINKWAIIFNRHLEYRNKSVQICKTIIMINTNNLKINSNTSRIKICNNKTYKIKSKLISPKEYHLMLI